MLMKLTVGSVYLSLSLSVYHMSVFSFNRHFSFIFIQLFFFLFSSMLPFSPSGLYCAFEQSEIIACAAGKGRGPWASWRRRRRKRKRREHTHTQKKWQDSNWQINRGGKWDKREKEREKYLCKDNGSTTPLWEQDSCPKRYDHITWHTYFTVNVWTAESWTITARMAGAELGFFLFIQSKQIQCKQTMAEGEPNWHADREADRLAKESRSHTTTGTGTDTDTYGWVIRQTGTGRGDRRREG